MTNDPGQGLTELSIDQINSIKNFFENVADLGEVEDSLFTMYDALIWSSNEEEGIVSTRCLRDKLFLIREMLRLFKEIEPRQYRRVG